MSVVKLKEFTKNLNILYVEDSLTSRNIDLKVLHRFFENVDCATNGEEAFSLYKEFYLKNDSFYDIVFSDLEMPIMNGEELAHLILNFNIEQEIVIISGVKDFCTVVKLINLGLKKFIPKPMQEDMLTDILTDISKNMRKKKLQKLDKEELEEYNKILKDREEETNKLLAIKIKELEEFHYALEVSAIVAKTDIKGMIIYVNQRFCDTSGYTQNELIGLPMSTINSGKRSKAFYKKLWNKITNNEIYSGLFENRNKKGELYYINSTISPIVNQDNEILEYISVSHDMTQLMRSLEAQKEAEKVKQEFFINISHEMRTPLNSILSFSSLLPKYVQGNEKALQMVGVIAETGNDLKKLVESVIDISKLNSGNIIIQNNVFDTHEAFMKCFDLYKEAAENKSIKYKIKMDENLPVSLMGDIDRVTQVLGILIDNAIKFTRKEDPKILVNILYDTEDEMLCCEVKDNGIGISRVDQEEIFDLKQLDGSLTRSHEGAGLGLHVASKLLKLMKGDISVKSVPHKGSVFSVKFPLKKN